MEEVEGYAEKNKLLPSLLIVLENAGYAGYCKVAGELANTTGNPHNLLL